MGERVGHVVAHAERGPVDDRRGEPQQAVVGAGWSFGDEEFEEVEDLVEVRRVECVDVRAVGEAEPLVVGAGEVPDQLGAVPAGLFVLELTRQVHRHVDLVYEADRVERVGDGRVVVVVVVDLGDQVDGRGVEHLVGRAHGVAVLDPFVRPFLAGVGGGGFGVVDAALGPRQREAGVEDPAGVQGGGGGVDGRQRRDRGERRRVELRGEQLTDAAVGDAEHADLVVQHPRLSGDGFDHVVGVEVLEGLEVVERAARAAGAAHVDVDHGETHGVREHGEPALGAGRVGVAVAGVFDQGRVGAGSTGEGQAHVDGELGAVAGGEVLVAVGVDGLVVDGGVPGSGGVGVDGDRGRAQATVEVFDDVAGAGVDVAEQRATEVVHVGGGHGVTVGVVQGEVVTGGQAGGVDLLDAAVRVDAHRIGSGDRRGGNRRCQTGDRHGGDEGGGSYPALFHLRRLPSPGRCDKPRPCVFAGHRRRGAPGSAGHR